MLFFSLVPFIFGFVSLIFFVILKYVKPRIFKKRYFRDWISSNLVFIFMIYPTITSYVFGMFNCTEIDGVNYLTRDFSIICWTEGHLKILLNYVLPIIIVWVFGYPLVIFIILYKHRANLNHKETIVKYGLFYIGFKDDKFYW
jgi:hypothetical protein